MENLKLSPSSVEFTYNPVINFALQQNYVPAIRELVISNPFETDIAGLTISVKPEPEFAASWTEQIGLIQTGASVTLRPSINPSTKFLGDLTEKLTANYTVTINRGDDVLYTGNYPVNLLAFDQWNGVGLMPEMLAAFSTPNHPQIAGVIRTAAGILGKWTGNPSFDEYQSKEPDRVRKQMAAIYEAIAQLQLIYCSVPASFEETGQRVRLADTIFSQKLANCLDMSLLYAACLEAVGIRPLLIITKGHAFTGAWLTDDSFADAVNDDPSLITKRMAEGINDIVVLEATCMNAGQQSSFDDAVRSGEQKMRNTDEFILFIDVKRARFGAVRPLPLRIATAHGWEIAEPELSTREAISPEDVIKGQKLVEVSHIDISKQRLWERKLLDLTLRNSLLNIRITKSVIQFMTVNAGKLEDALADGKEFQILGKPSDWDNAVRDSGLYQTLHQSDPVANLIEHELSQKRLRAYLPDNDLNDSLTSLYRSSRVSIEENGANTLYIALGLLKWYETDASQRPRYAPILLLPVEIVRKSAQRGFVIRSREEETMMNITLLEMLRQDFGLTIGGLDTLPRDESGVDVKLIFNIVRQAIMSRPRWDVEEQVLAGNFSFSKFILWNDIHNNADKLAKNKVVASLISGKLEWDATDSIAPDAINDEKLHPAKVALPISTDSSQLEAILSSGEGRSFVLHGPPGTGKSQTITNIIANALYAGKRVLFVAAKKAALDVVENRLESIGIGSFCLELHSNKAKKTTVLEQLKAATEVARHAPPGRYTEDAERLFNLRNELNGYVSLLHQRYPFGYSLFELITAYGNIKEDSKVSFPLDAFESLTTQQVTNWRDIAEDVEAAGKQISKPNGHALAAINIESYSPVMQQQGAELILRLQALLSQLRDQSDITADLLKLSQGVKTIEQEQALAQLTQALIQLPDVPASLLQADSFEQTLAGLTGLAEHGIKRNALRDGLLQGYRKEILSFSAETTLSKWQIDEGKWFLPRWLGHRSIAKSLRAISVSGQVDKDSIVPVLSDIINYQEEQAIIDKANHLPQLLGFLWKNGEPDWQQLILACEKLITISRAASALIGTSNAAAWRRALAAEFSEGSKAYTHEHEQVLQQYLETEEQTRNTMAALADVLTVDFAQLSTAGSNWKEAVSNVIAGWQNNLIQLPDWYNWLTAKRKAMLNGLATLISAYEQNLVPTGKVVQHFLKGFYQSAAGYILTKNPQLATFNGELFEDKIRKFKEISTAFETLTRQELYARLAANIPSFVQEASQSSEIGMLQRAIRNNGRAMSIRKIFDSVPNLLPRLAPCMLMSPISVAQYFDADSPKFDLVIFDEASQMPTCEAVGAIARGTNVIVVGDPKQMPPTSFFSTNNIDEDNIDKEDLESILDDCLALSMPSKHLLWHYRSKHESLIAFSNAKYYDNKLLTFPSTDDITSKVKHVAVEGFYDKGKTRTNLAEAKAIVNEVVRRLSDPKLARFSMGIVTFSSVQQLLVDDLLNDVFKLRPDLEKLALEAAEPLFIKNLENVQGDERDVILFSICYGPDGNGKSTLNFGPINREGGWRRLNVAVSRARYEMMVFSTLRSDQIDLNRTASEGVAGLKAFLAYAEKGRTALPYRPKISVGTHGAFEQQIAEQLEKEGYTVHTQIGCSDYKIDLAVVDPEDSERYILGLLTDGNNYFEARTSRDREIVQTDVLRALGWQIHKVWATEWWTRPEKVLAGIIKAIDAARIKKQEIVVETPPAPVQTLTPIEVPLATATAPAQSPVSISKGVPYEIHQPEPQQTQSADDIFYPQNVARIKAQIFNILEVEAPISRDLLGKRILGAWGIGRMGSRVGAHLNQVYEKMNLRQEGAGYNVFFWKGGQQPEDYRIFRIATNEAQIRSAEDLPPEEIANGITEILKNQISLPTADLIREGAKLFGYARTGSNVEQAMLAGIRKAIERGEVSEEGDRIVYRSAR
ncbi:DUF3320 domain-containing protein [Mucilaginibacter conchicola]|uniref:DUF3320 domain-containing protein n=1 Tax=Mucilaginibacter conchicola TaxID=2303333 RepID=A0A372NV88_9SPHI|nr:DUF3320 domain-containing protein [Mucilaginibacter conchicola]RFZ94036.1 DUF3320 domain-containing protein [Mucilaginibacter conchicola]